MWIYIGMIMVILPIILCIIFIDNKTVDYEYFSIKHNTGIKKTSSAVKILHLSDLHFPLIFVDIDALLNRILSEQPDVIAISGDIIKGDAKVSTSGVFEFIQKLKTVISAPIYYVNGNHENRNPFAHQLYKFLAESGVIILKNRYDTVEINGKMITFIGIFANTYYDSACFSRKNANLQSYKILLSHRPEKWRNYVNNEDSRPDLVLCGHAHGGQIRLFGHGLFAPGQGFFPCYTSGAYKILADGDCETIMIVSRGLGGSVFPFRFNNRPHVVIIKLE